MTGVRSSHARGFCSRIVLGRAGALVSCSICARVHRTKTSNTPTTAHKNLLHTHCGAAIVPLIPPAHVVCVFTDTFINRSYYNRCERRNRALLLRSSSRLQLWQSRQPCVVAAYQSWMQDKQLRAEAGVVSSSVKAKCQLQQNRQYGVGYHLTTLNARVECCLRLATKAKKSAEPLTTKKEPQKPRSATPSHCKATASHFTKKKKKPPTIVIWSLARAQTQWRVLRICATRMS